MLTGRITKQNGLWVVVKTLVFLVQLSNWSHSSLESDQSGLTRSGDCWHVSASVLARPVGLRGYWGTPNKNLGVHGRGPPLTAIRVCASGMPL
jgi:hypothetical protein